MAKLLDVVSSASIGNRVCGVQEAISSIRNRVPSGSNEVKNKLRVTLQVNSLEEKPLVLCSETKGVFAPWCDQLNKKPETDYFTLQPLNVVKKHDDAADIRALELELKLNDWRATVDRTLAKLGFGPKS